MECQVQTQFGYFFVRFSQLLTEVESDSLCSDPLVSFQSLNSDLGLLTGLSCRNLPAATVVFCSVSERCLAKVKALYTQDIHLTFKCGSSSCTSPKLIVTGFNKSQLIKLYTDCHWFKKKPVTNSLPLLKDPPITVCLACKEALMFGYSAAHKSACCCLFCLKTGSCVWVSCIL